MAIIIKVAPEGLRAAAKRQEALSNKLEESCARLKALTNNLEAAWQGNSGEQAANGLAELYDSARQAVNASNACTRKLNNVANVFESVDDGDQPTFVSLLDLNPLPFLKIIGGMPNPALIFKVMSFLNIDTDAVRSVAGDLTEVAATMFDARDTVNEIAASLNGDWEGKAYQKFMDESREMAAALDHLAESITEYSVKIRRAADRYEELDNTLI